MLHICQSTDLLIGQLTIVQTKIIDRTGERTWNIRDRPVSTGQRHTQSQWTVITQCHILRITDGLHADRTSALRDRRQLSVNEDSNTVANAVQNSDMCPCVSRKYRTLGRIDYGQCLQELYDQVSR